MIAEEIRMALDAATPGPWTIVNGRIFGKSTTAIDPLIHEFQTDSQRDVRNAHLIANAPTWLRSLLEENKRLTAEMDERESIVKRKLKIKQEAVDEAMTENQQLRHELERVKKELSQYKEDAG